MAGVAGVAPACRSMLRVAAARRPPLTERQVLCCLCRPNIMGRWRGELLAQLTRDSPYIIMTGYCAVVLC